MKRDVIKQTAWFFGLALLLVGLYAAGYYYGSQIGESENEIETRGVLRLQGETNEEILDKDTEYIVESHNLENDTLKTQSMSIPVEFIGLSKSEVIDYITSHDEQFREEGEELQNISMISFSHDMLVLRKDVTKSVAISETVKRYENDNPYNYYMVLENGTIIVYKQDKSTIFLETGIKDEELDGNDRDLLLQGIGVKNISELYRYLEGFTS